MDTDGDGVPVVLGLDEDHDEMQRDDSGTMAKRCGRWHPGTTAGGNWRCGGTGDLRVEDALVLPLRKKNRGRLKKVRDSKGR